MIKKYLTFSNLLMLWALLFITYSIANYYFRFNMAFQDPQFGLALEVSEDEDGWQSQSRVKLYLLFGADPNLAIKNWGTPLIEAAVRNKEHTVRLLLPKADLSTIRLTAEAVCNRPDVAKPILILLAQHLQVEPGTLCSAERPSP